MFTLQSVLDILIQLDCHTSLLKSFTWEFSLSFGFSALWRVVMSEMLSLDLLCSPYISNIKSLLHDVIQFHSTQITQIIFSPAARQISKICWYLKDAKKFFYRFEYSILIFAIERTNPLYVHSHRH